MFHTFYSIERFGVCARKIGFYHLDKANQTTNMDSGKWQKDFKFYTK